MDAEETRILAALGSMENIGPRNLRKYLAFPSPDFEQISETQVDFLIDRILDPSPRASTALRFADMLRHWDNVKQDSWTVGTERNTLERRDRIYQSLAADGALRQRIDDLIPFYRLEEPLIIAKEHKDWYDAVNAPAYYWPAYAKYLRDHKRWTAKAVLNLDNSTRAIVECLANPSRTEAYASKGLVMGYVQSGKTANFTGVIARAADAGYRLIVVLAGTWNILRYQTQRRIDKELLGKELLLNDESYRANPPNDWDEFLVHGFDPAERGYFRWERLTQTDYDYKRLKGAIDILEFPRKEPRLPLFDPANLRDMPVKLLVIKKHSGIVSKLVRDFGLIRTRLQEVPALFVDDESDQAGINTVAPPQTPAEKKERSVTNAKIVELLGLFPRGQYVGYTATPYANVFVDPDDAADLFPKDFIISLDRPEAYMGISDFFDPETVYSDLDPDDFKDAEIAFIRRVKDPLGDDDEDLKRALRSYVLSGALKLFRQKYDPERFAYRHHTMLVHISARKAEHQAAATRIERLWDECAFSTAHGLAALAKLWQTDFKEVSGAQEPALPVPSQFQELHSFLTQAIAAITRASRLTMVLNSDSKDAPDFGAGPVWRIIVGGNKLSRGYTIEGLTVSYYRRVSGTADTLMQMGRWFGFREGYRDLVRVFLGVNEGRNKSDLVELFKNVCQLEERFREEIKRYVRRPNAPRITPRDIPPLVQVTGQMRPTPRNKMFNAIIRNRNYGGRWSQPTLVAADNAGIRANHDALAKLMFESKSIGQNLQLKGTRSDGANEQFAAHVYQPDMPNTVQFIQDFHWLDEDYRYPKRPADVGLQIEFLENQNHGITSWLLILPQRQDSWGSALILDKKLPQLSVKRRKRIENRGWQQFGEPIHRRFGFWLSGITPTTAVSLKTADEPAFSLRNAHMGILLVYAVREEANSAPAAIGYEILYPENKLGYDINFSVRKQSDPDAVVVPTEAED
jgi:hypothetical protein